MKLRCPNCGHAAGMMDFANEEAARQCVYLVADLSKPLGRLVLRYIGLFRPSERSLSWERTLKLLQQLKADIDRAQIERNGRTWAAPEPVWQHALTVMIEKSDAKTLTVPLKSHGYLYEIIAAQQNSVETQYEQQLEEKRKNRKPTTPVLPQADEASKALGDQVMSQIFNQLGKKRTAEKE